MTQLNQYQLNEKLLKAVIINDTDAAKEALEQGADVNVRDWRGSTPLEWAAHSGNAEIVEVLKQHGGVA